MTDAGAWLIDCRAVAALPLFAVLCGPRMTGK